MKSLLIMSLLLSTSVFCTEFSKEELEKKILSGELSFRKQTLDPSLTTGQASDFFAQRQKTKYRKFSKDLLYFRFFDIAKFRYSFVFDWSVNKCKGFRDGIEDYERRENCNLKIRKCISSARTGDAVIACRDKTKKICSNVKEAFVYDLEVKYCEKIYGRKL
jgi:hypothetical protein